MMQWKYIVIVAVVLLLAFLCWKELRRPNRARLAVRLLASLLAAAGLLFLLLPLYTRDKAPSAKETTTRQDTAATGIQAASWQRRISAGAALRLQGRYNNNSPAPVKLLLTGFSERLDSVTIPPRRQRPFELTARPRHIGRAVYTLLAFAEDTLAKEPVPVEVLPVRPLKVLMLAASPDFENKFLANWLSDNGYIVAMRTTISRNKYSYTFLDTARFPLERITPAVLTAFDLLVADAAALAALSGPELGALRAQVSEKGLGIILRADSGIAARNFYDRGFALSPAADKNERALSLQIVGSTMSANLLTAPAAYLRPAPGLQPLVWGPQQQILTGSSLYGTGRLVCNTLPNTYAWVLAGKPEPYQTLWSLLIQQAARPAPLQDQWRTGPAFPLIRTAVPLHLETARPGPRATVQDAALALAQDAILPFRWEGIYWPQQAGWQVASSPGGDSAWWYAFDEKDWRQLAAKERAQVEGRRAIAVTGENLRRVPPVYFLLLLMLGVIFLWVEEKFV